MEVSVTRERGLRFPSSRHHPHPGSAGTNGAVHRRQARTTNGSRLEKTQAARLVRKRVWIKWVLSLKT